METENQQSDAELRNPSGVAVDAGGNLYIADTDNHRVRKVDADGTITTVAGNGFNGSSGDGGPAVDAQLRYPRGVAVDAGGNLYIADTDNHRIRKVDADGIITTVLGPGASFKRPSAIAVDADGDLYVASFAPRQRPGVQGDRCPATDNEATRPGRPACD